MVILDSIPDFRRSSQHIKFIYGADFVFLHVLPTSRVGCVHRVVLHVNVRIPAKPTALHALYGISGPEAPCRLVVVPRPQVVEADIAIELLAAVKEIIGCGAGTSNQAAKGVVLICVGDGARRARPGSARCRGRRSRRSSASRSSR